MDKELAEKFISDLDKASFAFAVEVKGLCLGYNVPHNNMEIKDIQDTIIQHISYAIIEGN